MFKIKGSVARVAVSERDWTIEDFAKAAEVSRGAATRVLLGEEVTLRTLSRVAKALNMDMEALLEPKAAQVRR